MESQPAILETATGSSGQSSSESIVSATRSGASSISTTFSKLDEPENNLILQIRQLQEEKKLLEGRIRGYLTLSKSKFFFHYFPTIFLKYQLIIFCNWTVLKNIRGKHLRKNFERSYIQKNRAHSLLASECGR